MSEPVTKPIDTVASGVGILYEPTRIRRKARAEADAAAILARGDEEVQEVNLRAAERLANNELRRQKNIESIVVQAVDVLPDEVSSGSVSEDWIAQFFNYSQDVGSEQMQAVWAKILAGEIAEPNSFSPRTLHLVRHLRQTEATEFRNFCSYIFDGLMGLRSDSTDAYLKTLGLAPVTIKNLENIGLLISDLSYQPSFFAGTGVSFTYFGQKYRVKSMQKEEDLFTDINLSSRFPSQRKRYLLE